MAIVRRFRASRRVVALRKRIRLLRIAKKALVAATSAARRGAIALDAMALALAGGSIAFLTQDVAAVDAVVASLRLVAVGACGEEGEEGEEG